MALVAMSPYDRLVHSAVADTYLTSGEPAISHVCEPNKHIKLSRKRWEVHSYAVTCLWCITGEKR